MKITHITTILQKQKHTLLSTFATKNNNEQQSQIHLNTRNFGNQLGKTPIWVNPHWEILFFCFRKKLQAPTTKIDSKRQLTGTQHSPFNYVLKSVPNMYCCTTPFTKQHLKICANSKLYRQNINPFLQQRKTSPCLEIHVNNQPWKSCPLSLIYGLYRSV